MVRAGKGEKMKMFQQAKAGKTWGYAAQVASQVSILVAVVNLLLIAVTAYNTTLSPWFELRGIILPLWLFIGVLVFFMLVASVFLYKFAVPSFFSAFNDQFYKHDNPMREDIDNIKKTQAEILRKLNEGSADKPSAEH